jgi:hypothetical protein
MYYVAIIYVHMTDQVGFGFDLVGVIYVWISELDTCGHFTTIP